MMKTSILFASISLASGILLVNVYNSIVDTKSWGSEIPNSIFVAREYFKTVNPGSFFRVFSPLNQVLAVLALVLFWKSSPSIRLTLGIAFVLYILVDILTFSYFYPRNEYLFKTAQLTDVDTLKKVWSEWNSMNWVRSFIQLTGLVFSYLSLYKIYLLKLLPD